MTYAVLDFSWSPCHTGLCDADKAYYLSVFCIVSTFFDLESEGQSNYSDGVVHSRWEHGRACGAISTLFVLLSPLPEEGDKSFTLSFGFNSSIKVIKLPS